MLRPERPAERPVNVLQVAASIAPRDGGPARATVQINREMVALGTTSVIVTTDADGPDGRLAMPLDRPVRHDGGVVVVCRRSRPYALKNSWRQAIRVAAAARRADVLHIHGVYLANSVWGYLAARLTRTPYVIQPHGTLEPYQRAFSVRRKRVFDAVIGTRILRGADGIIAASQSEADNIAALVPGVPVFVTPLGVLQQQPQLSPRTEEHLRRWLELPRERRVLFLGRLATKKHPEIAVDASAALDVDHRLAVVGPAQDWTAEQLLARAGGAADRIVCVPEVTPPEVVWIMQNAGVFVLPSDNENFGISVVEALANGCAVVTTAQTAAGTHVAEAEAGVILPRPDTGLLAEALGSLLADPDRAQEMGRNGRQYAERNLSWGATARRLQDAYRSVIRRAPAPR